MQRLFTFRPLYLLCTIGLLLIEIIIASFVHDAFVRPYLGDLLVVILLYCLVRSFFSISVLPAALTVLAFAFLIEMLQYFQIVNLLGLGDSKVANIIIGNSFEWKDILMYILGIVVVWDPLESTCRHASLSIL